MAHSRRRFGRWRKEYLGLAARETFVPQSYDWGGEGRGGSGFLIVR
jgi:hypothetical protein